MDFRCLPQFNWGIFLKYHYYDYPKLLKSKCRYFDFIEDLFTGDIYPSGTRGWIKVVTLVQRWIKVVNADSTLIQCWTRVDNFNPNVCACRVSCHFTFIPFQYIGHFKVYSVVNLDKCLTSTDFQPTKFKIGISH